MKCTEVFWFSCWSLNTRCINEPVNRHYINLNCLIASLKLSSELKDLMWTGNWFQVFGPITQKSWSVTFSLVEGTSRVIVLSGSG